MPTPKKRADFYESEDGERVREALSTMVSDSIYMTNATYSANSALYPDNLVTFVEKHMKFLSEHQEVNINQYLSNLRLMSRIRR